MSDGTIDTNLNLWKFDIGDEAYMDAWEIGAFSVMQLEDETCVCVVSPSGQTHEHYVALAADSVLLRLMGKYVYDMGQEATALNTEVLNRLEGLL